MKEKTEEIEEWKESHFAHSFFSRPVSLPREKYIFKHHHTDSHMDGKAM